MQDAQLDMGIKVHLLSEELDIGVPLFSKSNAISVESYYSEEQYKETIYHEETVTMFYDYSQVQNVTIGENSQTQWDVSNGMKDLLVDWIEDALNGDPDITVDFEMHFVFERNVMFVFKI